MDDKVHQLVPQHLLSVEVRDEEADVVTINLLPPKNYKVLCPPHHEPHEFVTQQLLYFISLFNSNGNPKNLSNIHKIHNKSVST